MSYDLSDTEAVLLDGRCRPEIQTQVDAAKNRIATVAALPDVPVNLASFIADVAREAVTEGRLICQHVRLSYCRVCKKSAGYAKYARSGRHHRAGQENRDRPLTMSGVELAKRWVTMRNRATLGCCQECWQKIRPHLADSLRDIRAEIPEQVTGEPSRWQFSDLYKCKRCAWEGPETHMRQLNALMGGHYYGGCPKCKAENRVFGGQEIASTGKHVVLPVATQEQQP